MKILIVDDDPMSRRLLELTLLKWNYEVVAANDGREAWRILQEQDAPAVVILDWMMPGLVGPELCRLVRQTPALAHLYIIFLTIRGKREDIVEGLQAGADDYVAKPYDASELRARLQVGVRTAALQAELARRVKELEEALAQVKQLQGYLPICSYCKKIRDDEDYWEQVDNYISAHSEALFTHTICPECYRQHVEPELAELRRRKGLA